MLASAPFSGGRTIRYSAFISYNHRDRGWAVWLHRALEAYRIPERLREREGPAGALGDRLAPVFRDRDELAASANLGEAVRDALAQADTLIVICSPNAVASRWVNEEIRAFAALGRAARIRCLIVDGEPHAADPARECLPPALFEIGDAEPLAADVRKGQDGRTGAKLKLLAAILDVPYDELRQREAARRQRRLAVLAAFSVGGFLLMAALTVFALLSRAEAVRQRDLAGQRRVTAERTVDFVKSMFEVSDPSEARGATITAREVLDRGARLIDRDLGDEPAVKAELGLTLSEVYGSLGLFRESDRLIRRTLALRHDRADIQARQALALGESQARLGEYEAAATAYRRAIAAARASPAAGDELLPRALVRLGEAQSALGDGPAAERSIREALRLDRRWLGDDHPDVARDLEALGLNAVLDGDTAAARPRIERALAIRLRKEGELSPSVSDNLNTLASIAYLGGDSAGAEGYYRRNLRLDEKVLGPDHPDLAATLNNLARVLIERRAFTEASPLLERALAINLKQRSETHDDLAFTFSNLALARRGMGRLGEAEALFERALRAARLNRHRTLGPILTDLAELRCRTGRAPAGIALLAEARPIVAETYPDDPWRTAWTDNVLGGCLIANGRAGEGRALIASSRAVIATRWPAGSYYRYEADRRGSGVSRGRA